VVPHNSITVDATIFLFRSCFVLTEKGRQFWVMAAERSDTGRFIVHADQDLSAFLELESAIKTHRHNH